MAKLKKIAKDLFYFENNSTVTFGASIDNPKTRDEAWNSCTNGADMLFVLAHCKPNDVAIQAATKITESIENVIEFEFVELAKARLAEATTAKESFPFKLMNVAHIMSRACCNGPCQQTKDHALAQICDTCWETRQKALKNYAEIIRQIQPACPNMV